MVQFRSRRIDKSSGPTVAELAFPPIFTMDDVRDKPRTLPDYDAVGGTLDRLQAEDQTRRVALAAFEALDTDVQIAALKSVGIDAQPAKDNNA